MNPNRILRVGSDLDELSSRHIADLRRRFERAELTDPIALGRCMADNARRLDELRQVLEDAGALGKGR